MTDKPLVIEVTPGVQLTAIRAKHGMILLTRIEGAEYNIKIENTNDLMTLADFTARCAIQAKGDTEYVPVY